MAGYLSKLKVQHARHVRLLVGSVSAVALVAGIYAGAFSGANARPEERTISLYSVHTKETLTISYKRDGEYDQEALVKINGLLRDWRAKRPTRMDPALVDLLWELHKELDSKKPIHVISGFRSAKTNKMLRRRGRGVARRSMHLKGQAADVYFPDVPTKRLRESALLRERGGVGYYPRSGRHGFVHVDTGRVRHWPRMHPVALARLFKSRGTKHRPGSRDTLFAKYRKQRKQGIELAKKHVTPPAIRTAALAPVPVPRVKPSLARPVDQVGEKIAALSVEKIAPTPRPKLAPRAEVAIVPPQPRSQPIVTASLAPAPIVVPVPRSRPVTEVALDTQPVLVPRPRGRPHVTAAPRPQLAPRTTITASLQPSTPDAKPTIARRLTDTVWNIFNAAKPKRSSKQDRRVVRTAALDRLRGSVAVIKVQIAPGLMINRTKKGNLLMSTHRREKPATARAVLPQKSVEAVPGTLRRFSKLSSL